MDGGGSWAADGPVGSLFALEAVRRSPTIAGLVLESAIADPLEGEFLGLVARGRRHSHS